MALVTKVNLKMVSGTEKAFGKEEWAQMLIDMMEIIKMIKSKNILKSNNLKINY
jgi:flagellar biogenesis protein FliO